MKALLLIIALTIYSFNFSQIVNIPDFVFKTKLLSASASNGTAKDVNGANMVIDINNDNEIQVSEALNVYELKVTGPYQINDLTGVEYFVNLTDLDCSGNYITDLDVSTNVNLTHLNCSFNRLTSLDLSNNINLISLDVDLNDDLAILNVSNNIALISLACSTNVITNLDLGNNINLDTLFCGDNIFSTLDLSHNSNLTYFNCKDWQGNINYINLKNGNNSNLYVRSFISSSIQVICVDDTLNTSFSNSLTSQLNHSVIITEDCLGNTINGTARLDVDNDGCSSSDIALSNSFIVTNNGAYSFTSSVMDDASFLIPAGLGNFTTSIQNLPPYWSASPNLYTNTFTSSQNTFVADFCITANQTINDISISILPTIPARPGFNAWYRIVYTNTGTTLLSGDINFVFDFNSLSFLNASESITSQTANSINFGYSSLAPFETRTIDLEFNVNAPTASSPVNINDTLSYTATITPTLNDNTVNDNTFILDQIVIGSYDPNNITCLEGSSIYLENTDEYLHYLIRFQNSGTASAINVNVKNNLDSILDWSTLTLENTSHTARVDIRNGNQVTFIFDNINLPDENADEPGSHGFVAYKIKPKNNVVLGDQFDNVAHIFFDYNTAIVTNTATTEIINNTTSIGEENNTLLFSVYPVLAEDIVTITSKETLQSLSIYSNLGQLVLSNKKQTTINVSSLSKGLYFVKATDLKGNFGIVKIIKK